MWNGDPNLLDGRLEALRAEYDERLAKCNKPDAVYFANKFKEDKAYLRKQLSTAAELLKAKTDDVKTKDDKLKELSWEVVEISSLLDQACHFFHHYDTMKGSREDLSRHNEVKNDLTKYHKGLYKKKRQPAATHVLVIMASEEKRRFKPYALPIQYIPYHTITSKQVLVFVDKIKKKMVEMDMKCIGKYLMLKLISF